MLQIFAWKPAAERKTGKCSGWQGLTCGLSRENKNMEPQKHTCCRNHTLEQTEKESLEDWIKYSNFEIFSTCLDKNETLPTTCKMSIADERENTWGGRNLVE